MTQLSKYVDHTALAAAATPADIKKLAAEAKEHEFFSVCVNPVYVPLAKAELAGSDVKVCTVIGFPLGASSSAVKALETKQAIADGADEVDMVIQIGAAKAGDYQTVEADIRAVVEAANGAALVKVILETCLLSNEQIVETCLAAKRAGAEYVKTSTGFSTHGATIEAVKLMRETVGEEMGVKASGGIRTAADFNAMITAGASRIGASAGPILLEGN
ncbi:deoxyribose-phosphate aldolase [Gleimia coleocanis DSM 15436]|uniref:Deoxyribose-phosphate aldolase n=1 Tax=Gleimia coleocanis DSM 15436 TaxID=525245 RepID=C0W0V9_9ACTO|nr:deoxyribose-phosphate aldolase [Gleimia coleocanis]EEH63683.1 deoxyribose-phosphate aldolase [Gleimia coleocanis DSM 15436]